MREAVGAFAPELLSWTEWLHESEAPVYLPDGNVHLVDRGAEQGDPLGSAYCALVVALVMQRTRERLKEQCGDDKTLQLADVWYMDDGQVFCHPAVADKFLQAFDFKLQKMGASRGTGADIKSMARLLGNIANLIELDVG